MAQTAGRTLEIITDSLAGGYPQLVVGTFQEASEIMNRRRLEPNPNTRQKLRYSHFYTANLPLERIRDGKLEYGLSGRETFYGIAGQDIGEFSRQLTDMGFYRPTPEQIAALPSFADIEWVDPSKLNLQIHEHNPNWSFFEVDTSDYSAKKLNGDQRRVAQRAYGSMERKQGHDREYTDFGENMNMIRVAGKTTTRIYFPTPSYAKESIKGGEVVARYSWLDGANYGSWFSAGGRDVSFANFGLLGVRNLEEGGAPKVVYPLAQAYRSVLNAYPTPPVRLMIPEIATRLDGLQMRNP